MRSFPHRGFLVGFEVSPRPLAAQSTPRFAWFPLRISPFAWTTRPPERRTGVWITEIQSFANGDDFPGLF